VDKKEKYFVNRDLAISVKLCVKFMLHRRMVWHKKFYCRGRYKGQTEAVKYARANPDIDKSKRFLCYDAVSNAHLCTVVARKNGFFLS
jgi:hypothetical protein